MNFLLVILCLLITALFLRHRKKTREQWQEIARIIHAIDHNERPASFILHGGEGLQQIGLGLEKLSDQRERLESQLSREGFNLQALLASMKEGVMVVDTRRIIRLVNGSFLELFNLKATPEGRGALHTLHDTSIEEVLRHALNSGEPQSREITLTIPNRVLAMSAAPVRDNAGGILGVAATFHDITLIKQLEQVRRDFVANVSHELRTPLSIFQGYVEMMRDNPDLPREEVANTLQVLSRHSARLNALVEDLLTLARMESRRDELHLEPLDAAAFLREIESGWKLKFQTNRVRFCMEISPDFPVIHADALRLEQVFNNLLENALKYTPAEGSVIIQATRSPSVDGKQGRDAEIRIIDTGSGIPKADLPHVFERFYRADKARSRALGGTGLGLSIVKHIVQLHGGSVRAESKLGAGSTFIIRLPAAPST